MGGRERPRIALTVPLMLFKIVLDSMAEIEAVASLAIAIAKDRRLAEVGPDELLLAALRVVSRFGTASVGTWIFDLEKLGIDWLSPPLPGTPGRKVSYSVRVVELMDLAARVAKADAASDVLVSHLLVAFSGEEGGLMGELKRTNGIDSASWRAALAQMPILAAHEDESSARPVPGASNREYLTPEEAAEELGLHVQTLRAYVRSGKLPAARLAGERAIRIRRDDLQKVLEPLQAEKH